MFGFFKSKSKDKVANKDKAEDKEKKKENKEENKVNLRSKDDKARSYFRKSKSSDRSHEDLSTKAKSKSHKNPDRRSGSHEAPKALPESADISASSPEKHCKSPKKGDASEESSDSSAFTEASATSTSKNSVSTGISDSQNPSSSSTYKAKSLSPPSTLNHPNKKDSRARNQSFGGLGSIPPSPPIGKQPPSRSISDGGATTFPTSTIHSESSVSSVLTTSTSSINAKPPLIPKPSSLQPYTRPQPPRGPALASKTSSTATTIASAHISRANKDDMALRKHYPYPQSISSPPSSPGLSSTHSMPSVHDPAYRSVSPEGRMSLLSTPSSSTSSLTSITSRPISPSGRRTPPGPRMGTGGRLSSSPTPTRKTTRTNIKTNPGTRLGGSVSPVNHLPSNSRSHINNKPFPPSLSQSLSTPSSYDDTQSILTSAPTVIVIPFIDGFNSPPSSPPVTRSNQTHENHISYTQITTTTSVKSNALPTQLSVNSESKSDSSSSSPRSVSPSNVKSRHSVASMHSLESIPENDSDSQVSTSEYENKNNNVANSKSKSVKFSTNISNQETKHSECEKGFISETNNLLTTGNTIVCGLDGKSRDNNNDLKKLSHGANAVFGRSDSFKQKEFKKLKERIENEKYNTPKNILPIVKEEHKTSKHQGMRTIDILSRNTKLEKSKSSEKIKDGNISNSPKELESKSEFLFDSSHVNSPSNAQKSPIRQSRSELHENVPKSKQSLDPEVSHFVFSIPMKEPTSNNDAGKRHSIEIMQKDGHPSTKSSKEARNQKAKSASFCHEPQRGQVLETPLGIKRSSSSGPAGIVLNSPTQPQKRERHRSLSRSRQRSKEAENKAKLSDSDDEVIIPWRRRPRSASRKNVSSPTDNQLNKSDNSIKQTRNRSSSRGRTNTESSTNRIEHSKSESTVNAYLQDEQKSISSQNKSSRNSDRRKTQSINLDTVNKSKLSQLDSESPVVPNAQSSSPISDETPESLSHSKNNSESSNKSSILRSSSRQSSKSSSIPSSAELSSMSNKSSSKCQEVEASKNKNEMLSSESVQSKSISDNDNDSIDSEDMVTVVPLRSHKISQSTENIVLDKSSNNIIQSNSHNQLNSEKLECKSPTTGTSKHRDSHRPRRRSVSLQTHVIKSTSKQSQTDPNKENLSKEQQQLQSYRKELATQEERYQKQVDGLTIKLASKQDEVSNLQQQLDTLKGVKERLSGAEDIQAKLDDLQKTLLEKNSQMDGLRVELQYSRNEVELTKSKLKKLEEDLDSARQKNQNLQTQITSNNDVEKMSELETKIKEVETNLQKVEEDRDRLKDSLQEIETERDEELKIIQDALDEAAQEREDLIATFEKELEGITTINQNREAQLMEDFENKLREIERDHKKKTEERDKIAEEQLNSLRNSVESELSESITKVAEDRRSADEKLKENTLTRGRRQTEDSETEYRQRLEKSKSELNAEWEDKLRSECSRLKTELDGLHSEGKQLAVDTMRITKEQEMQTAKRAWDTAKEDLSNEISSLKDRLTDKEFTLMKDLDGQRTLSDREIWDLRRKLQKLDENIWTQKEAYEDKIMRLNADYEDQVKDLKMRLKLCENPPTSKSELEAVYKEQIQHLATQHTASMERLREESEADKYASVEEARVLVSKHMQTVNASLKEQLSSQKKSNERSCGELDAVRFALKQREDAIHRVEEELNKMRYSKGMTPSASLVPELQASYEASMAQFSEDTLSELNCSVDSQEDPSKSGSGGILGKMFGGGWFSSSKSKDSRRNSRHST